MRHPRLVRCVLLAAVSALLLTVAFTAPAQTAAPSVYAIGFANGQITAVDTVAMTVTIMPAGATTPLVLTVYATKLYSTNIEIDGAKRQTMADLSAALTAATNASQELTCKASYDPASLTGYSILAETNGTTNSSGNFQIGFATGSITAVDTVALTVTIMPTGSSTPLVLNTLATKQFTTNYWIEGAHNQTLDDLATALTDATNAGLTLSCTASYDPPSSTAYSIVARAN